MERFIEKAREYTIELMKSGGYSYETLYSLTDIPVSTIKNFCSGKTSKNPGFDTVLALIKAMGGDINEIISCHHKTHDDTYTSKETYEMRIADLIKSCEDRIEDVKALCELRIADVQRCCELRIVDMRHSYEERLKEQREMLLNQK